MCLLSSFQAIKSSDEGSFREALNNLKGSVVPHCLDVIEVKEFDLYMPGVPPLNHGMCLLAYAGYYNQKEMIDILVDKKASE